MHALMLYKQILAPRSLQSIFWHCAGCYRGRQEQQSNKIQLQYMAWAGLGWE